MRLSEYLSVCEEGMEITVWDKDYDIEVYFYGRCNYSSDEWDVAITRIAKQLEVVEISEKGVTVNMSETIEKHLEYTEELFIENDIDAIMDDIENIFAGHVSEEWLNKFAKALSK